MKKLQVSIVIITLVRKHLYTLVDALHKQKTSFDFEIVVVPHKPFDAERLNGPKVQIFPQKDGRGLSFYRNQGVKNAQGEVIAFIDDDEMPKNTDWLQKLVDPILKGDAQVTTAGTDIPLQQGFLADSISLLGYPGGAAIGFKKLWHVDAQNHTNHLCSGNFAIKKSLFNELGGFDTALKFGTEDVSLSQKISKAKEKILYVEEATVDHLPRTSFIGFMRWHFRRGLANSQFSKLHKGLSSQYAHILKVIWLVIKTSFKTPYFAMVLILLPTQYFCQLLGMIYGRFKK